MSTKVGLPPMALEPYSLLHNSDSTFACLKTAKNQNNPFFKANIEELYFVPISMLLVLLYGSLSVSGAASLKNHNSNLKPHPRSYLHYQSVIKTLQ